MIRVRSRYRVSARKDVRAMTGSPKLPGSPCLRSHERGFVLVTAIMFVLILSILGSSLLAHGPLENSLVTDRTNNTQSFYHAESGMARGVKVLQFANTLDEVNQNRPASLSTTKVPLIRALQFHSSSGGVDSSGTLYTVGSNANPITLISTGQVKGVGGVGTEIRSLTLTVQPFLPPGKDPR